MPHNELSHLELHNIFIPSKVPSNELMVILHGRGDSAQGFITLGDFIARDSLNYLLLDAPFEYYRGYSWYQLPPNQLPGIEYSISMLNKIFDALFEDRFQPESTLLFGFSQGSLLTYEFGARYKEVLAGYIAISGYIYDERKVLHEAKDIDKKSFFGSHGSLDEVLPLTPSKEQVEYLISNGFSIDFHIYEKDHSIAKEELEDVSAFISRQLPEATLAQA